MSSRRVRGAKFGEAVGGLGSDDEDLYSGYNEYPSALTTDDLEFDNEGYQNSAKGFNNRLQVIQTGRGKSPGSAMGSRLGTGTAAGFTRQGTARSGVVTRGSGTARPITGIGGEFGGVNRPMTAVRGAGYTTSKGQKAFDPMRQGIKSATPSLELKLDESPEGKIKQLEEKISMLIEDSVLASCKGNFKKALEHSKEAQQKERSLLKLREQVGLAESHDWDISFSVLFNLANQYEACEMYTEALSTYQSITKNKFLVHGAKVKINMGNIHLKQNQPTRAIKMYRMAMDQLTNNNRDLRLKLMHNMGVVFLRINHPEDAAASFEYIMAEKPTFKTGLHLVVSNYMSGDPERTKRSFRELLEIPLDVDEDEEKYSTMTDDPVSQLLVEVLKNDKLRKLEKEKKTYAERCVLSAARLIAPVIENTFSDGYGWVTESIKSSRHASLAHALEISKALVFLKQRDLAEAVEILKSFEKKETKVATAAATNLSFLFYLQGDLVQAEKYGEIAREADYYNSSAFVNLGNCMGARGEFEKARQAYQEALSIDSSCVEALFNLGLMSQRSKFYEEALDCFHKIIVLVRNHPHVTFQIGKTHELMGENEVATEWYLKALALMPSDSGILKKLAQLHELDDDRPQAYQYYYDCYKLNPSDIGVVEWLASYLLNDKHVPDRAIIFYEHGKNLQPNDPKWGMAIGACHRKTGNYNLAISVYQRLHKDFPDNIQVLQQLVKLTQDIGSKDFQVYTEELRKLEKTLQARDPSGSSTRISSGSSNSASGGISSRFDSKARRFGDEDSMEEDFGYQSISSNAAGSSDGNGKGPSRQKRQQDMLRPNRMIGKRNEKSAEDKPGGGMAARRISQRSVPEKHMKSNDDDNDDLFANVKLPQDMLQF